MTETTTISRTGTTPAKLVRPICSSLVVTLGVLLAGCGGGDDGVVSSGVAASFSGSGTPAQANAVRLVGGATSGDIVTIEVVCGETDRNDVYGFVFDLVLDDPAAAEYVANSVEAGNAFHGNVLTTAQQHGERVVVGVTQTDQTGDKIAGPESVVVRLRMRVSRTTAIRFEGSIGSNPTNDPCSIDSKGSVIESVTFDGQPATLVVR